MKFEYKYKVHLKKHSLSCRGPISTAVKSSIPFFEPLPASKETRICTVVQIELDIVPIFPKFTKKILE